MHRKAATPVDWAVGSVFFITLVAFTFYYAYYLASPVQPYEAVLRNAGTEVGEKIASNVTWALMKVPVIISANSTVNWPMQVYFRLPDSAYRSTLSLAGGRGGNYSRLFRNDTISWTAPLSPGKNYFYILYSGDVNLTEYSYATDISVTGPRVNNTFISASFSSSGQDGMIFGGREFFFGSGMSLGASGGPAITNNTAYAEINYTNGVSARIYSNISKVAVLSNHTIDASIRISTYFTAYYAGGSNYSFGAANYTGVTDFVDAYNTTGLAVIGRNVNFSVSDMGSYREVLLYNVTEFEIYAHGGNYTVALGERDAYLNPPPVVLGVPQELRGVSWERFQAMSALSVDALKAGMDISGVGFKVLFNETENYTSIPDDRGVLLVKHPVSVLGRFGAVQRTYLGVAVWSAK